VELAGSEAKGRESRELTVAAEVDGFTLAVTHACELEEVTEVADLSWLAQLYHTGGIAVSVYRRSRACLGI
jgi:hypothetical protein